MSSWRWCGVLVAAMALAGCSPRPQTECPVTVPNGSLPPGEQAASAAYLGRRTGAGYELRTSCDQTGTGATCQLELFQPALKKP